MFGIFLPTLFKKKKRCERCSMHYEAALAACPHCESLADGKALNSHVEEHQQTLDANKNLGTMFIGISVILLVLMLLAFYN